MAAPRRRWWRHWRVILIAYLVIALIISALADRLILFPSRNPISIRGQTPLTVTAPSGALEVWVRPAVGEPDGFVLAFIGNASRAEHELGMTAEQWAGQNVEIWSVNYPGYGGSEGSATLKSIPPAALAAYDTLRQKAGSRPIYVAGNSLGTTAALHVAANRPVAGLVLSNPPALRQLILIRNGWWNLWLLAGPVAMQVPSELDSVRNARQVTAPAVFISSSADEVVPAAYHQRVIDAFAGPKQILRRDDAHHNAAFTPSHLSELRQAISRLRTSR